uniref:MFS transporter n=1 Tax=Ascaris lumbricoides TaxID=6252 RepID=A0A0M3IUT0_ASCLU
MRRIYAIITIFVSNICVQIGGSFTADFNRWLIERYGLDVQSTLNR